MVAGEVSREVGTNALIAKTIETQCDCMSGYTLTLNVYKRACMNYLQYIFFSHFVHSDELVYSCYTHVLYATMQKHGFKSSINYFMEKANSLQIFSACIIACLY